MSSTVCFLEINAWKNENRKKHWTDSDSDSAYEPWMVAQMSRRKPKAN